MTLNGAKRSRTSAKQLARFEERHRGDATRVTREAGFEAAVMVLESASLRQPWTTIVEQTLLFDRDEQLTDADGDTTPLKRLQGRKSIFPDRDEHGIEQFDLLEGDPETGAITPILDNQSLDLKARQHPIDLDRMTFGLQPRSITRLDTLRLDEDGLTGRSEAAEPVMGHAWSPDGQRLVYQAGTLENATLRLVDRRLERRRLSSLNRPFGRCGK